MMKLPIFFLLSPLLLLQQIIPTQAAVASKTYETTTARRERNLDHWDAETLAHYLGLDPTTYESLPSNPADDTSTYAGIDASIMFYAQWCKNCHNFAPLWDTIATLLHAGTTQGNIILALFNCELNKQHTELCNAAGVTHYPTLMHVGAGPYPHEDPISKLVNKGRDSDKAEGPFGASVLDRTIKFQGNYAVGDSVLDWIKTMKGMSTWYRWNHFEGGWLKSIRRFFLGVALPGVSKKKEAEEEKYTALPVGVPPTPASSNVNNGKKDAKAIRKLQSEVDIKTSKLNKVEGQLKDAKEANAHAGYLIENFLFPPTPPISPGRVQAQAQAQATEEAFQQQAQFHAEQVANAQTLEAQALAQQQQALHQQQHAEQRQLIEQQLQEQESQQTSHWNDFADPFTTMTQMNAWIIDDDTTAVTSDQKAINDQALILKTCVVDLTLDYCTRLSTKLTNDYLDTLKAIEGNSPDYPSFTEMESHLTNIVAETEPYCHSFNSCYMNKFVSKNAEGVDVTLTGEVNTCRPTSCPFNNVGGACRYLSSCLEESIQKEYKTAIAAKKSKA